MIGTTYHARLSGLTLEASRIASELAEVQEQATTGLAVSTPSDAPESIEYIHRLSSELSDQGTWSANAERSLSYLDTAETAMDQMGDVIDSARELATQLSSAGYNEDDRAAGAAEVDSMLETLVSLANSKFDGRYIFAGTAYDSEAYDSTGTYLGSSDQPSTITGESQEVATGFVGSVLFQDSVDIFGVLTDLADALEADDVDAIQATLEGFDSATTALSTARGLVATEYNQAEDAMTLASNMEVLLSSSLDDATAADPVAVYTRLAELQTTYEATLQLTSASQSMNLFSML